MHRSSDFGIPSVHTVWTEGSPCPLLAGKRPTDRLPAASFTPQSAQPSPVHRPLRYRDSARCFRASYDLTTCAGGWTATQDTGGAIAQMFIDSGCGKETRVEFTAVRPISSVIVLVDFDDVKEMKLGALTDYISMVGLAQVDLDGNWGDTPTILRLFSNSTDTATRRMSAWDRSFLKALYS